MRIAPELHLKRLIVGGFRRVFEMNRCFRNEGLSIKHNPEFTSIEFYQAYATYEDLMAATEELVTNIARDVLGKNEITYGERTISLERPFKRMTMREAVAQYGKITVEQCDDVKTLTGLLVAKGKDAADLKGQSADRLLVACFEDYAEHELINPTFITEFPSEVSPHFRAATTPIQGTSTGSS